MISLEPSENADYSFVAIVEQILNNTLQLHQPAEVYLIQIDNWFDHKWLEFDTSRIDTDDLGWRSKLRLPPFEPSRVISQLSFLKHHSDVLLYAPSSSNPLHILYSKRTLLQICPSGVFLWYSYVGNGADQGSLMVYLNNDGKGSAWYASFTKNPDWRVNKMKGISKQELTELLTTKVTTPGI